MSQPEEAFFATQIAQKGEEQPEEPEEPKAAEEPAISPVKSEEQEE